MLDQKGKPMMKASRLSVNVNPLYLAEGKIVISAAQVFGLDARLYQETASTKPNYQFVVDSLSNGNGSSSRLDLRINSFIVRNGSLSYDRHFVAPTPSRFNPSHISISKFSTNITVRRITEKSLDIAVKKLSFNEKSGFKLTGLSFALTVDKSRAQLKNFSLLLPGSHLQIPSISATYSISADGKFIPTSLNARGNISGSSIMLSDLSPFVPQLHTAAVPLNLTISFACSNGQLSVKSLNLRSADRSIRLSAKGTVYPFSGFSRWNVAVDDFFVGEPTITTVSRALATMHIQLPKQLKSIGNISLRGNASGNKGSVNGNVVLRTAIGNLTASAVKRGNSIKANLVSERLDFGFLLSDKRFGTAAFALNSTALVAKNGISAATVKGAVSHLNVSGYTYRNIDIDGSYRADRIQGSLSIADPNCSAILEGSVDAISRTPIAHLAAKVAAFNPQKLGLSNKWGNATFSMTLNAHTTGIKPATMHGNINLRDFHLLSSSYDYSINSVDASVQPNAISVKSDFGNIDLNGKYNIATLHESLAAIVKKKLPTLPGLDKRLYSSDNSFRLDANITDTRWLEILLGIPFRSERPIQLRADIDDLKRSINAEILAPDFNYSGNSFKDGFLHLDTQGDTLFVAAAVNKEQGDGGGLVLGIDGKAADNRFSSTLSVNYRTGARIHGTLCSEMQFFRNEAGANAMRLDFKPSRLMVKDTTWTVHPSSVIYNGSSIQIEHFAIEHGSQHIRIDGLATKSASDSICVDLRGVDVNYILNLVNFHSVEFSGYATGQAYLKSVLNTPDAYARLRVDNFHFEDGRMGTLYAAVDWNKTEKQIDIDAHADEETGAQTIIKGYVSPAHNYIDLGITAHDTNIEFLQSFCGSFMDRVNARANGFAQVYGDLSAINLRGLLVADGSLRVRTLNTVYNLQNDTVRMEPNEIIFNNAVVTDRNGNHAIVNGALHHKNLTRLTFDLDIATRNFLCYDFPSYDNNTFFGTVYGTGNCSITGRPHSITFNVDVTPEKDSFIEYNAASPDAITNQNFISWVNRNATDSTPIAAGDKAVADLNESSDIHINVSINTTPDFTLRVLMDPTSGDRISLNGTGALKATYFNKGTFDMYGTYLIDHGTYNLTIQNIIEKKFQFQQGSSIVFGGSPFNALLDLKAVYPVNGVSLADLKIGNSFTGNNVRVDCIMNIGGTPENISVDFDFDMPTVNNDAKQMVRSLINSEEEMNQQVVYLLAIGRFYIDEKNNSTQEAQQQSQTSLAMQSLLSGTISQQVNNILGSVIKNNNWNFGTNISTGTEGFNNAEYEGLLSGSLFSNRLLLNGQFGYRDNPNTTTSFIGDFDVKYLLTPNGNIAIKVYNQTNDRYFTKSSLNTQGLGIILKRDFGNWRELFRKRKK